MSPLCRTFSHLTPFACALSLALALPAAAQAQASSGAPAAAEATAAKDLPLAAAERQQFVGTYLLSAPGAEGRRPSMPFRIYEEGGALYGQPQGGSAKRMLYQGENTFRPEAEAESVVTFTVEGGRATRFSVASPQGTLEGVRESK